MKIKDILNKIATLLIPIAGALLGAIGGSGNKEARRIVIPLLLTSFAYSVIENIFVITIISMAGALSIGYGIPDSTDRGSVLGRFFMKITNNNHKLSDILTRGIIGKLIALSLISVPIIKHNWIVYAINAWGIILVNSLISWRNFGSYKLFGKELSWVETITWGLITLCAVVIIYFGGK